MTDGFEGKWPRPAWKQYLNLSGGTEEIALMELLQNNYGTDFVLCLQTDVIVSWDLKSL